MKLSDYVFEFVATQGVKHVFMVPGGGAMHLNNSLGSRDDVAFVCTAHEQASAIAAEAYARVTNNLGVALLTTGPGGTNAVTGVDAAWLDSTPCLFISGQVKRADLKKDGLRQLGVQETDVVTLVSSITKYAVTVTDPMTIRYHLERAVWEARSGRPGPVWIAIPLDVQAAEVDVSRLEGFTAPSAAPAQPAVDAAVAKTLALLNASQRPVILVGNGVRLAGAQEDFLRLVEQLGVPVLTTRLGVDLIPAEHPLSFGMPGTIASRASNFALQNSDFLMMLGARMDMALIGYAPDRLARGAKKVMVNVDAAEIRKLGEAIDVAAAVDARAFIGGLSARAGELAKVDRSAWLARCRDWKARYPFVTPKHVEPAESPVSVYAFSDALSGLLKEGDVVLPGSAGNACEVFLTAFKAKARQRIFHNKGTGAMGLSQPSAIGAALASGRPTVCIDGDGGFALNVQELQTVRRLGLPIVFFVMNNGGYASIRASQQGYFGKLTGADAKSGMTLPDLDKLAAAYGLGFARLADMKNLKGELERILALPRPLLCEVVVIPDEPRAPRVSSMQKPDGSMVSKPLEDMWPFLEREEFRANMIVEPLPE